MQNIENVDFQMLVAVGLESLVVEVVFILRKDFVLELDLLLVELAVVLFFIKMNFVLLFDSDLVDFELGRNNVLKC
jgi:hypothetical protein